MTISERIFNLLDAHGMSQKEFSELTGIAQKNIGVRPQCGSLSVNLRQRADSGYFDVMY